MSSRPELKLDWCSYQAAKYAVEHWHYSCTMPRSKNVYMGVWEAGGFMGALVFGLGGGNATNGRQYGLERSFEVAELERVALRKHDAPVSRIVSIAVKMLRRQSPKLRLLVSYADPEHGHVGAIYQAGNWIYVGQTSADWCLLDAAGRRWHSRVVSRVKPKLHFGTPGVGIWASQGTKIVTEGKHKYLLPLDDEMHRRILPLTKPYPKRVKDSSEPSRNHREEGGAAPTHTLQLFPMTQRLRRLTNA